MAVAQAVVDELRERRARRIVATVEPPPLESGDRLTRYEFERRYHAMPHVKKAELIEGVVYMPSAVRFAGHAEPHAQVITWLGVYCAATPSIDLVVRSQVFPGLHLAVAALLEGDLARVLAELHKGLETAEHATFVERL